MTKERHDALEQLLRTSQRICENLHDEVFGPEAQERRMKTVMATNPRSATEATMLIQIPKPEWLLELEEATIKAGSTA